MKLLYVWIEKFRNIYQQGFAVDSEYFVSFDEPEAKERQLTDQKVYCQRFSYRKNPDYAHQADTPLIQSVTALVGKNASGKTSIMECLYQRADQFNFRNPDQRYYCLVFLDEKRNCLLVRARGVLITNPEYTKTDLQKSCGYDEYVFPLAESPQPDSMRDKANPIMVSIYQDHRENAPWKYESLGMSAYPVNLGERTVRSAFLSIFDFMCAFPALGGQDNTITFWLHDDKQRGKSEYFTEVEATPQKYKHYYIIKLSQLLFGKLRTYLYHPQPEYSVDGHRIGPFDSDALIDEDRNLAEMLSFSNCHYPSADGSLITERWVDVPQDQITATINFLRGATYSRLGKSAYIEYLNCVGQLFSRLYETDAKYFTGYYKLNLPFSAELRGLVEAMSQCIEADSLDGKWADDIVVDLEWLSAGEYQRALLFSGIYEVFNSKLDGRNHNVDLILLFDEPEVHMHPEAGRKFFEILTQALKEFQKHGLVNQCQLILATHSPFIIQKLADYNSSIELVAKENNLITWQNFNELELLSITTPKYYSFNLVMYYVFGVPTVELHIELYGYIQEKANKSSIAACDNYILSHRLYKKSFHEKLDAYGRTAYKTLPTYIRNAIDHPDPRRGYDDAELEVSIKLLLGICQELNENCN